MRLRDKKQLMANAEEGTMAVFGDLVLNLSQLDSNNV
jgi:hypothetical protein